MSPPRPRADRVLDAAGEEFREEWADEALHAAATVAALALDGVIPPEKLPTLHGVMGTETAYLVSELMQRFEQREVTGERLDADASDGGDAP